MDKDLLQGRINIYNQNIEIIRDYYKKYCQALKEIWKNPRKSRGEDLKILEKYELGKISSYSFDEAKFIWDYDITQLNKLLRSRKKERSNDY